MSDVLDWLKEITPGGVGIWTGVITLFTILIRQGPINRKLTQEREGNLLRERALEMKRMRARIAQLELEQRADRHTIQNLEACLDALMLMIEVNPERAAAAVDKVRAMRAEARQARATEKAGIASGVIAAAALGDAEALDEGGTTP